MTTTQLDSARQQCEKLGLLLHAMQCCMWYTAISLQGNSQNKISPRVWPKRFVCCFTYAHALPQSFEWQPNSDQLDSSVLVRWHTLDERSKTSIRVIRTAAQSCSHVANHGHYQPNMCSVHQLRHFMTFTNANSIVCLHVPEEKEFIDIYDEAQHRTTSSVILFIVSPQQ